MRLLWLLLLLCVAVVRFIRLSRMLIRLVFVAFAVCVSVSCFDWHRFIWFRITFESIVNNNNNTKKRKKKLNTNKRTKQAKRSVFLPLNAMLWSNWRVSVRRVFLYTHIFSFWFSSFSIQCAPSDSRKLFSFTYIHMYIQSSISFFTFDKVFIHNFMIFVYTIIPTNSVLFPSFSEPIPHFIPRKLKSCFRWLLCCFLLFLVVVVFLKK